MLESLSIKIVDVNFEPIPKANVSIMFATGTLQNVATDNAGGALLSIPSDSRIITISAQADNFESDLTTMLTSQPTWDNPCVRVDIRDKLIEVTLPLGRIRFSPGQIVDEARLKTIPKLKGDTSEITKENERIDKENNNSLQRLNTEVRGVLMLRDARGDLHYLGAEDYDVPDFRRLDPSPPSRSILNSAKATAWDRFVTASVAVAPYRDGVYYVVEYGSKTSTKLTGANQEKLFAVALYIPKLKEGLNASRDVIVFLPPHTSRPEYNVAYPYGLNVSGNGERFEQPFVSRLGIGYFFGRHHFIRQILSTRRQPIIIMPIWHGGATGPLLSQTGILRLVREVLHFVHQKKLDTQFSAIAGTPSPPLVGQERSGSTQRTLFGKFNPTPDIGKVAVAGFSVSGSYVNNLISAVNLPQGYGPEFGVPAKHRGVFSDKWSEIWDLDGSFGDADKKDTDPRNYRNEFFKNLVNWYKLKDGRGFRIARSSYTGGSKKDLTDTPLSELKGGPAPSYAADSTESIWAYDYYSPGKRWSALVMSGSYIKPPTVGATPMFGQDDEHQFLPNIGLAWALLLSTLA